MPFRSIDIGVDFVSFNLSSSATAATLDLFIGILSKYLFLLVAPMNL